MTLWLRIVLLIVAGLLSYASSLRGEFIFDDLLILDKSALHHLWPLTDVVSGTNRPILDLSLALNYAWSGKKPISYHQFNLGVHLLNAILLFLFLSLTLRSSALESFRRRADELALTIALIWEVHPLQTGAVTYISQRAESLMACFFLAAFLSLSAGCYFKKKRGGDIGAIVFTALSLGVKEVAVVIPVLMLLYEKVFHYGSFKELWRQRQRFYYCLFATWLIPVFLLSTTKSYLQSAGFGNPIVSPWEYARTQPEIIFHYLRLVFWPLGLCLDYQWPIANTFNQIFWPALGILILLGLTFYFYRKKPALGFAGFWFFGILSITSSFLPIQDLAFEHRMYLPSVAVIAIIVMVLAKEWKNTVGGTWLVILLVSALGFLTYERNKDYRDPLTMWQDIVKKRPLNIRAKSDLGLALAYQGEYDRSEKYLMEAIQLKPDFDKALNNLGLLYYKRGELEKARTFFEKAVKANSQYADAFGNLGLTLLTLGDRQAAQQSFEKAVEIDPTNAPNYNNLGMINFENGNEKEAAEFFKKAIHLQPHLERPYNNLGMIALKNDRYAEAEQYFLATLKLAPDYSRAWNNYGIVLVNTGRFSEAHDCFKKAVEIDPDYEDAWHNLRKLEAEWKK